MPTRKKLFELEIGDVLAEDVVSRDKVLLLEKGTTLTQSSIEKLFSFDIASVEVHPCLIDTSDMEKRARLLVASGIKNIQEAQNLMMSPNCARALPLIKFVTAGIYREILANSKILMAYGGTEDLTRYSFSHCFAVTIYSVAIAHSLGLSPYEIFDIGVGAAIHDIGMEIMTDKVWKKRERLNEEEKKLIRTHTVSGALKAKECGITSITSLSVIEQHHERSDGSGYPDGRKGDSISMAARIVSCADVFVAMISDRPHRKAFSPDFALRQIISNSGELFSKDIVAKLVENVGVYPTGSYVTLSDGRQAKVVRATSNPFRPVIELREDRKNFQVDLSTPEFASVYVASVN